jgi:hypothetical protein
MNGEKHQQAPGSSLHWNLVSFSQRITPVLLRKPIVIGFLRSLHQHYSRMIAMLKLTLLPLTLGLIALTPEFARADTDPSRTTVAATSAASPIVTSSAPPVYGREKIVGRVQAVQGSTIVMALDNGTTRSVALPDAAGGDFNFLVGQRIVLTDVNCAPPIVTPQTQTRVPDITPQRW